MAYIYAFAPNAEDCSTIGLVGALLDEDAEFDLKAGEFGELTFKHPIDPYGKWRALVNGAILKTMVPMRVCPGVKTDGQYITTVDRYTVARTATKTQRYIYSKKKDGKKKKLLGVGRSVTVTGVADATDSNSRYSVRLGKISGWMERAGLTLTQQNVPVADDSEGMESVEPSYAVRQQLFRIYEVKPETDDNDPGTISVSARRIVYDLMGNITTYKTTGNVSCLTACNAILNNTLMPHDFNVYTDIGDVHVGFDGANKNPIEALIGPDEGVTARWGAEVVSDDFDIYILRRAGMNRGVSIEYAKNLIGVSVKEDVSNIATAIRPKGENKNGTDLYLNGQIRNGRHIYNGGEELPAGFRFYVSPSGNVNGTIIVRDTFDSATALPKIHVESVGDAKVEKGSAGVTINLARRKMVDAAVALFNGGCDVPDISMSVDFVMLGDTDEYAQYKHLEPLFVYDTVRVRDRRAAISADINLTSITWLVREERVSEADFGALTDMTASISGWQISSVSGGKLVPGSVGAGAIDADSISANHIQANSINTDALQANSVTANKLAANAVDAQAIAALTATINAITAGDISTNTLSAAFAHLMQVVADNIQAGTVTADALDAVMASIVSISVGAATFDLAEIKNLLASALVLDEGQAGSMHITNLAVTSANLLNATVGKLVIKGDDDNYYEVGVGSDGVIRTAQYDATAQEIADGRTTDGRQIVTETINAEAITGATVKAQEAVLNRVLTAALTAGQITANDAMLASASIPLLYTTSIRALGNSLDISANQSIRLLVGNVNAIGEDIRRMIRIEQDGLHVGDSHTTNEVLVDSESVNVVLGGFKYSKFAADYVQFGDYQLRRSVDGGLVFKKA